MPCPESSGRVSVKTVNRHPRGAAIETAPRQAKISHAIPMRHANLRRRKYDLDSRQVSPGQQTGRQ